MKNPKGVTDFQIALLMDDVNDAKYLSDGLREIGIFAHYYQDLDELWVSLNSYTPDLCIIDVKKMSQGTLLFKQHKKVKTNELKYAFYYKDSSKLLLRSAYGLNHYGVIRGDLDPIDQLKSLLRRRNEELRLIEENNSLLGRVERLKSRSQVMTDSQEKAQRELDLRKELGHIIGSFGQVESSTEAIKRVNYIFENWDHCKEFGIYHLNGTKQKLVSPHFVGKKYQKLPDLWLSAESVQGIEDYALEMAYDVCYGVMEKDLKAVRVFGGSQKPEILIVGKFTETVQKDFEWHLLENKLTSEYRLSLIKEGIGEGDEQVRKSTFEVFQYLDDIQFHRREYPYRLALVNLEFLVTIAKQRANNRVYWKMLEEDLIAELKSQLQGKFFFSNYGVDSFLILLDKKTVELDFVTLKNVCDEFKFWRYFDDTSLLMGVEDRPTVKLASPSSINIIRQMHDGFENFMEDKISLHSSNLEV